MCVQFFSNNETPATIAYSITEPEKLVNELDSSKRTIFYIFGYKQFPEDENVQLMMDGIVFIYEINRILQNE